MVFIPRFKYVLHYLLNKEYLPFHILINFIICMKLFNYLTVRRHTCTVKLYLVAGIILMYLASKNGSSFDHSWLPGLRFRCPNKNPKKIIHKLSLKIKTIKRKIWLERNVFGRSSYYWCVIYVFFQITALLVKIRALLPLRINLIFFWSKQTFSRKILS